MKWIAAALLLLSSPAFAEETIERIEDNSFLIEEAYNQEKGVVQHINAYQWMDDESWEYSFTQEWPVTGSAHQLSYTVPYQGFEGEPESGGFGDALLNYRYQLIAEDPVALAPRVSLILPTGDEHAGRGHDVLGYQLNLPLSVYLGNGFVTHWNLGATWLPHATGGHHQDADLTGFNYGASLIWIASEKFNLMLEAVGEANEDFGEDGEVEREESFLLSPGMRLAIDFDSGLQVVPGLAMPIGVGPSHGDYGVFAYLSFEHPFTE